MRFLGVDYGAIDREGIIAHARKETGIENLVYMVLHADGIDVYETAEDLCKHGVVMAYSWEDLDRLGLRAKSPQAYGIHPPIRDANVVLS